MSIPDAAKLARYDDLANLAEELHDENMILRQAIRQTLEENGHLADGENCTLIVLKRALRQGCGHEWQDDGDNLQTVCTRCGERHDVDLSWRPGEVEEIVERFMGPNVRVQGRCAASSRSVPWNELLAVS